MIRRMAPGAAAGVAAAALSIALWHSGALDRLESATWAWRVNAMARPSASTDRIALILLDQASLDWGKNSFGWSWPWPREIYTPIIEFCRRGGARGIAFDVLYTEPSVYGAADDAALGLSCAAGQDVIAAVFLGNDTGSHTNWPSAYPAPPDITLLDGESDADRVAGHHAARALFPISDLATNVAALANVSDQPDPDGVFRRAGLLTAFDDRLVPSLGTALWMLDAPAASPGEQAIQPGSGSVILGGKRAELDAQGRAILRYRGPSQTHRAYNAAAVIRSELLLREGAGDPPVDPAVFQDRYVLFGFSAPGLLDQRTTPVDRVYPGVEIHATVLDNLLEQDFIREPGAASVILFITALAMLAGACVRLCTRASQTVIVFLVALPIPFVHGFLAYGSGGILPGGGGLWWPVAPDLLAVLGALIGTVIINYATEGRQKAFIKQAFRHYLSEDVIEKMIADPSRLQLGGERRELTIFFSDLQGFSAISENMDAVQLTALLNDYLTDMTEIILASGGTLDKYEGDAIMAFWNAPMDQPDHALRACEAALACSRRLAERCGDYREKYGVELKMRIGINTGEVVVGNMGSHNRFDYTVLGDAANLASRLEGANKVFGTWIMISEATWSHAGGDLPGRKLGRIRVVGRAAPVPVYELVAAGAGPDLQPGLEYLGSGDLRAAQDFFAALGDDEVARKYTAACTGHLESESPWDGTWNLTEK